MGWRVKETERWYGAYYGRKGSERNSLLNPEVLLQTLAYDASIIRAFRSTELVPRDVDVMDLGCGSGGSLTNLLRLGVPPERVAGVDLLLDRLRDGSRSQPAVRWACADGCSLPFRDGTFDLILASTLFVQVVDNRVASLIADEMERVTKLGGFILLADWRYSRRRDGSYLGLSDTRINSLFGIPERVERIARCKGMLVPPLGRMLSKRLPPFAYFMVQLLLPFAVGQVTTVLRKRPA